MTTARTTKNTGQLSEMAQRFRLRKKFRRVIVGPGDNYETKPASLNLTELTQESYYPLKGELCSSAGCPDTRTRKSFPLEGSTMPVLWWFGCLLRTSKTNLNWTIQATKFKSTGQL